MVSVSTIRNRSGTVIGCCTMDIMELHLTPSLLMLMSIRFNMQFRKSCYRTRLLSAGLCVYNSRLVVSINPVSVRC